MGVIMTGSDMGAVGDMGCQNSIPKRAPIAEKAQAFFPNSSILEKRNGSGRGAEIRRGMRVIHPEESFSGPFGIPVPR